MPLNAQGYIGMKFKFKNTLLVSFLAIAGILGVNSALIKNSQNVERADAASASTTNHTTIYINDGVSWNFRTLYISEIGYASGYNADDLEYFCTQVYGTKQSGWSGHKEDATPSFYRYDNAGVNVGFNLATTISNKTGTFYLPNWITDCRFQLENNSNYLRFFKLSNIYPSSGVNSGRSDEWHYAHTKLNSTSGVGKKISITGYQYGNYDNCTTTFNDEDSGTTSTYGGWNMPVFVTSVSDNDSKSWTANAVSISNVNSSGTAVTGISGGPSSPSGDYINFNKVQIPATTGTKTGYSHSGWAYTYSNFASKVATSANTYVAVKGGLTIYSIWSKDTFKIKLNGNGSTSGSMSDMTATYDTNLASITSNAYSKTGYNFLGWSASSTATSATFEDGDPIPASTINAYYGTAGKGGTYNLYAVWEAVPTYTLSGSVTTDTSYNFGTVGSDITDINSGTSYTISSNTITVGGSTLTATPTTDSAEWDYSFWKWTDTSGNTLSNGTITADLDVVAWFTRVKQTYTITWKNGNNTTIETDNGVEYGATPSYDGATPTKTQTAQYTYTWDGGWTPTPSSVTGNATYTATFSSTLRSYTVTWKNYDDTTLETDLNVNYGTTPTYNGATPTKSPEGTTTYSFSGWSPAVGAITGDTTYTAQFDEHTVDPEASGWYGGEVYYAVDEYNRYGNPNYFRIYFLDSDDSTAYFTYSYSDPVVTTVGGKNVYKVVIPEYTGSSDLGWTKFIITEYKNNTDTSPDWDTSRVYQTTDLYASFWKNYNRWWIKDTDGSGQIKMGYDNESSYNGMLSGNTYYLEIMDDTWDSSKYKAIYFHTPVDASGSGDAWALCRKIEGISSGFDYGLYEFIAPKTAGGVSVTWSKFIVVELTSGTTLSWDNKNKQSPASGGYTIDNPLVNAVKSNGGEMYQISDAQRLGFFDTYFNSQIGGECKNDGSTNLTNLKTKWGKVAEQLPMDITISNQFKTETPDEYGDANEQAAARYDYVLGKYETSQGLSDFADRKNGGHYSQSAIRTYTPFSLFGNSKDSFSTVIIIVASSVALLSVTALSILVIRKRKTKEQ